MSYRLMGEVLACCRRTAATPPERFVLLTLGNCANAETGQCNPSIATLCALTGYSRATVQRALNQLEDCGAITITRRRRQTSQYVLHPTALEVSPCDSKGESLKSHLGRKKSHPEPQEVSQRGIDPGRETGSETGTPADAPAAHRRVAAHTVPHKPAPKEPPDPRVKVLLDEFCRLHLEALHEPYQVRGKRDGQHLKDALRLRDADRISAAIRAYFRDKEELDRYPASVPHCCGRIAFLLSRNGSASPPGHSRTAGNLDAIARGLGLYR